MMIRTAKLSATATQPERMRATVTGGIATLTIPFPYHAENPHAYVAEMMARAYGYRRAVSPLAYNHWQAQGRLNLNTEES